LANYSEFLLFLFSITALFLWIITKRINEHSKNSENRQPKGHMPFKMTGNFISSYVKHHIKTKYKTYIPLMFSLSLITIVVSIVDIYFQGFITDNNDIPSFVISPYTTEVYKEYGAYRIYETVDRGMSIDEYLELSNTDEIKNNSLYVNLY
jgi:hypothetical protein